MKRTRLRPISAKRRAQKPAWDAVCAQVDARAEGRCEVVLDAVRCHQPGQDRHHCKKPRASHHDPALIIKICRPHHQQVDAPYDRGRLFVAPFGDGTFHCQIVTARPPMISEAG